jgi:protein phosphatase
MTARADRTTLRWGGATHVGRVRSANEDNYLAADESGLWAVADGMGGHSGGEVASQIACVTLGRSFTERTVDGLVDAVEHANTAVHRAGSDDPMLTGMGTTVVALAIVDHEGSEVLAIANVGDSRCYRWSQGELDQLTTDHSLVADLVREGSLSPEEAAVHPQRNIVTRVLGVYDSVPVDVFVVDPHHGDRYVLCSDGLFNEVPEPAIATVLRRLKDPGKAAAELVRLAIEGGGRDNITVVVVDVVDDGGKSAAASAALAGAAGAAGATAAGDAARPEPAASPAYSSDEASRRRRPHTDTAEIDAVDDTAGRRRGRRRGRGRGETGVEPAASGVATATLDEADDAYPAATVDLDDDGRGGSRRSRRGRRFTWRVALFSVLVLALVAGVVATIQWYGTSAYFVAFEGDQVAIFQGRPGGLLWIEPELVTVYEIDREQVPGASVADIESGVEQATLSDARRYVDNVRDQAEELEQATTTTAPTTTTTRPPATTAPPRAPGSTAPA